MAAEDDDQPERGPGCVFPGECCMPGEHTKDECHTAEMVEDHERSHREHDWSGNWNELSYCVRCMSFEGATTTECPGERMDHDISDRVYKGEIDFRNGEWCNQPAIGMSHVYGHTREPYVKMSREEVGFQQHDQSQGRGR